MRAKHEATLCAQFAALLLASALHVVVRPTSSLLINPAPKRVLQGLPTSALRTAGTCGPIGAIGASASPSASRPEPHRYGSIPSCRILSRLAAWPWEDDAHNLKAEEAKAEEEEEQKRQQDAELLRYTNRAAILEHTLRNKQGDLKKMTNRVTVLQDVATKLKESKAEAEATIADLRTRAEERDELEATLNATYDELARETGRLQSLLDEEVEARRELLLRYDDLTNELETRDSDARADAKLRAKEMADIERSLMLEMRGRKKDRTQYEQAKLELESRFNTVRDEAKGLDVELNRTVAEVDKLRRQLDMKESQLQSVAKEERRKRHFLKEELVAARMAEREAAVMLERLEGLQQADAPTPTGIGNMTEATKLGDSQETKVAEDSSDGSLEIATAAVRAAEEREASMKARLNTLQGELRTVLRDNDKLDVELRDALEQRDASLERLDAFRNAHGRREEALTKRVVRAEQNLRRLEEEMGLLRGERDDVRESLLSERLRFASERREDQQRYDRLMREERESYEVEISTLKAQLSQRLARVVSMDREEDTNSSRFFHADTETERSGVDGGGDSSVDRNEPVFQKTGKKKQGRLGRVLQRIRSPRSWFAGG